MSNLKFSNDNSRFFQTLRSRVQEYFDLHDLKHTGNYKLYLKTGVLFSILFACYITLVFFTPQATWVSLLLCTIMGITLASIGFNVMHDGAHGSYSSRKWVNQAMSYSLNLMGGDSFIWKQKHNINHHSYTNIEGMDDDIDIRPFIRVHSDQKRYWYHRFQHVYAMLLYGFTYLFWVFYNDFKKYFTRRVSDQISIKKISLQNHFIFWATKLFYVVLFIGFPIYMTGLVPTLVGYSIIVFVTGLVIAVVFQLAHVIEEADFVAPTKKQDIISNEWAVHQLTTTANFATRNRFLTWLLGGLNFQIEHHLFPRISHIHYPVLSEIVKATCLEYSIAYTEFPTMRKAVWSHLMHLKRTGGA